MLQFTKMNGAGNDFILADNRDRGLALSKSRIAALCDRNRGIGADGMLLVEPADSDADFRMRYYNSDGGEAEMCGNGARCFARYSARLVGMEGEITFDTQAGRIHATLEGRFVKLNMGDPTDLARNLVLEVGGIPCTLDFANTGVPHAVLIVDDIDAVDVRSLGADIRHHPHFSPKGTNANFIQRTGENSARIRTYERGVENETLACGTGVVAGAIVFHEHFQTPPPITLRVQGGENLTVDFQHTDNGKYRNVTLHGPADFVFDGIVFVENLPTAD